jgi:hypothetical protein
MHKLKLELQQEYSKAYVLKLIFNVRHKGSQP